MIVAAPHLVKKSFLDAVLTWQEKHLREENEQLAKNISCLFNTAKAEIARKEKWIDRLREELQAADAKIKQLGGTRR